MSEAGPPGWVVSAPHSGAGKTVVTLGILRALHRKGVRVQPAKSGPDFIDPQWHTRACDRRSVNLDSWAMRPELLWHLRGRMETATDLMLCEGAMGLFDGALTAGEHGDGSAADLAAQMGWKVLLVLDVSGQMQSAAAVALGLSRFRSDVEIGAVLLNRVASERHAHGCRLALDRLQIPVLGALPRSETMALPSRHLGLVQAGESMEEDRANRQLDAIADTIEAHVGLEPLLHRPCRKQATSGTARLACRPPAQRIAVALDEAFSFMYPHLLQQWQAAGAEVLPFSPLADQAPSERAELCWLPGGYPELHAAELASCEAFLLGLRRFARDRPVHGECGGYMVLGQRIVDGSGVAHRMAGLLSHESSFQRPRLTLGYRRAVLADNCPLGKRGERFRGHEFHYSVCSTGSGDQPLFSSVEGNGTTCMGSRRGPVSGSYLHYMDGT